MRCVFSFLLVGLLGIGWTSAASAQNLIVNGDFESGGLSPGWTGGNFVANTGFNGIPAHGGSFYLAFGAVGGDANTSQTVTTTAGATYDLQFFYWMDGGTPGDLNVYWNGVNIYSETSVSTPHPWQQHDLFVTGTGSDTVTFGGRNDPTWNGVDDVSLTLSAVPEPATWTLMGIASGAIGSGLWWNRKRSQRRRVKRQTALKKA